MDSTTWLTGLIRSSRDFLDIRHQLRLEKLMLNLTITDHIDQMVLLTILHTIDLTTDTTETIPDMETTPMATILVMETIPILAVLTILHSTQDIMETTQATIQDMETILVMEIIPMETIPVMETILILAILILHSIHHTMEVMTAQMVHTILHIMESMMVLTIGDLIMEDVMAHIMKDHIMEVTIKKVKINRNLDSYKELKASSIMTNLRLQEF